MLRNKPIRCPGTPPMGSSIYGDDDLLSVAVDGEETGSGCRDGCSRISLESVMETFEKDGAAVYMSRQNYSVHNRCMVSRVNSSY